MDGTTIEGVEEFPRDEIRGFDEPRFEGVLTSHLDNLKEYRRLLSPENAASTGLELPSGWTSHVQIGLDEPSRLWISNFDSVAVMMAYGSHINRVLDRLSGGSLETYLDALPRGAFGATLDQNELDRIDGVKLRFQLDSESMTDASGRQQLFVKLSSLTDQFRQGGLRIKRISYGKDAIRIGSVLQALSSPPWSLPDLETEVVQKLFLGSLAQRGIVLTRPHEADADANVLWVSMIFIAETKGGDIFPIGLLSYFSPTHRRWVTYSVFRQSSPRAGTAPPIAL